MDKLPIDAQLASAPGSLGIGSRSGILFIVLRKMLESKRMEKSPISGDPVYFHTHDCQGCEGECNGIDGLHAAQDAADVLFG